MTAPRKLCALQLVAMMIVIFGTGCSPTTLIIEELDEDRVITDEMPELNVSWAGDAEVDPNSFIAKINGFDITEFFEINETSAALTISGNEAALNAKLRNGLNTFRATIDGLHLPALLVSNNSKILQFLADKAGPIVHIDSVVDGLVRGRVEDVSQIVSLDFRIRPLGLTIPIISPRFGPIPVDSLTNEFSLQLTAAEFNTRATLSISLTAVDATGETSRVQFIRDQDGEVQNTAKVIDDGSIARAATKFIKAEGINLIKEVAGNATETRSFGLFKLKTKPFQIRSLGGSTQVFLPRNQSHDLAANVVVQGFSSSVEACIRVPIFGDQCVGTFVNVPSSSFNAKIDLRGSRDKSFFAIRDIDLAVFVPVVGAGFSFGPIRLPNIAGSMLLSGLSHVAQLWTNLLDDSASLAIAPLIQDVVNGVLQDVVVEFEVDLEHGGSTRAVCFRGFVNDITRTPNGDLLAEFGTALQTKITGPGAADIDVNPTLGVRLNSDNESPNDRVDADGNEFGLVVAVSTNIINQLLHGVHQAAFLNLQIPDIIELRGRSLGVRFNPVSPAHIRLGSFESAVADFDSSDIVVEIDALIDEANPELGREVIAKGLLSLVVPLRFLPGSGNNNTVSAEFTDQINTNLEIIELSPGQPQFLEFELASIAIAAAGPILSVVGDALSEVTLPSIAIPGTNAEIPLNFWFAQPVSNSDAGSFRLGIDLEDIVDDIIPSRSSLVAQRVASQRANLGIDVDVEFGCPSF